MTFFKIYEEISYINRLKNIINLKYFEFKWSWAKHKKCYWGIEIRPLCTLFNFTIKFRVRNEICCLQSNLEGIWIFNLPLFTFFPESMNAVKGENEEYFQKAKWERYSFIIEFLLNIIPQRKRILLEALKYIKVSHSFESKYIYRILYLLLLTRICIRRTLLKLCQKFKTREYPGDTLWSYAHFKNMS